MELIKIKERMLDDNTVIDVSEIFKVLADSTRIKILNALEISELCVTDICTCVDMNKSAVSHQLRILRQAKLVKARRNGKEIFYSLDDEHVSQIFECAIDHVSE